MKTSTFLTLSTSVLVGLLDASFATSPPPRDYYSSSSSRGSPSHPSKTYEYKFPTQTSSIPKEPKYTEPPRPVKGYPYVVDLPESPDISDPPQISNTDSYNPFQTVDLTDPRFKPLPLPTVDIPEDWLEYIKIPDDIRDPLPLPHPSPSGEGGFYWGPDGEKIAVKINPPGFGENPIDRQVPSPGSLPSPPPPFSGDAGYRDGDKYLPVGEPGSPPTFPGIIREDTAKPVYKRHLKDLADDVLADLRDGYDSLKTDFDDIDLPDFGELFGKYLPSKTGYDFNLDGNGEGSDPPPYKFGFEVPETSEPLPFDYEFKDPEGSDPPPENFYDIVVDESDPVWHPKSHSHAPPHGYAYQTSVPASKPAPSTFATVTRSAGTAHPTGSYGYKYTLPK